MLCGLAFRHASLTMELRREPAGLPFSLSVPPSLQALPPPRCRAPSPRTARTDEVRDGGQVPQVLQELVQGVAVIGGNRVLVLQQQLQVEGESSYRSKPDLPPGAAPAAPLRPPAAPLTLCVLTSSPTVMYTTGLATATISEYSSIAKRSSGSGTWQARQTNLLSPEEGCGRGRAAPPPVLCAPAGPLKPTALDGPPLSPPGDASNTLRSGSLTAAPPPCRTSPMAQTGRGREQEKGTGGTGCQDGDLNLRCVSSR